MNDMNLTPNKILESIFNDPSRERKTYIILGRSGPTGKTWLWNELRKRGLNAIEISEQVYRFLDYNDNGNHCIESTFGDTEIIVLNKPLKRSLSYKGTYA